MDALLLDLRQAIRGLRRSPGFTLAALTALAAGIGASVSIFSVLDAVLFRPLPLHEPDRLAQIYELRHDGGDSLWAPANYLDLARETRAFSSVAAYYDFGANFAARDSAERVQVAAVTQTFFGLLGVPLARGRDLLPGEDLDGVERTAIVSDDFFRRELGGEGTLGTISLNGRPVRVIGVLPAGFRYTALPGTQVFVPIRFDADDVKNRGSHYFRVLGRLAPQVTLAAAQTDLRLIALHIAERDPHHRGWSARAGELREALVGKVSGALQLLFGAVLLVLLVACANVAGLLLARGAGRHREIAIRAAIGGGRARIVRLLLTEALLLSLGGGVLGLVLAAWSLDALVALAPPGLPRLHEVRLDLRVTAFALALSLATGVAAGLWPALQTSRTNLTDALRDAGSAGISRARARRALVVCEIAAAVVLVAFVGLLLRSFQRVLDVPLGFRPDGVLAADLGIPIARWPSGKPFADFYAQLVERVSRLPGVVSAAATTLTPLVPGGHFENDFHVEGHPPEPPGTGLAAQITWVTPGLFATLGIPLVRGRAFDARDGWRTPPVVLVNQAFVRKWLAPGEEPVGARLRIYNGRWDDHADEWSWTIAGVVSDVHEWAVDKPAEAEIYLDAFQQPSSTMTLLVRATSSDPLGLLPLVRRELLQLDATVPLANPRTLSNALSASLGARRFQLVLLGFFGLTALLLAALGIYGLVATSVAQRTHEFGIRMALGAQPSNVLGLVLGQGLRLAALGVCIGTAVALGASRALTAWLFEVAPADPLTYLAVGALLIAVAALATLLPARRATRVDPATALRAE